MVLIVLKVVEGGYVDQAGNFVTTDDIDAMLAAGNRVFVDFGFGGSPVEVVEVPFEVVEEVSNG